MNKNNDIVVSSYADTIKHFEEMERLYEESLEISGLSECELHNFLQSIPFSNNEFNRFLKKEFHNGRLNFMYKEYLESIGK